VFGFANLSSQPLTTALPTPPVIQTKLKVSEPNSKFEEEAERLAELTGGGNVSMLPSTATLGDNYVGRLRFPHGNPPVRQGLGDPLATAAPISSSRGGILQRKCSCGGSTGMSGACEECSEKKRLGLQTKLKVGEPNDHYEREADDVAASVMRMPRPAEIHEPDRAARPQVQLQPQAEFRPASMSPRKADAAGHEASPLAAPAELPLTAGELTSGGSLLPATVRTYFEQRMGYDLSGVRIHQGTQADRYNERLSAQAFTIGSHVWLGQGQALGPTHTLAHEFVHVIQQTQPPILAGATAVRGEPPLRADWSIQREEVYWGRERGFDPADAVQDAIVAKNPAIQKEVWMPGANRGGVREVERAINLDKDRGIADLYKSDNGKRVGLYFRTVTGPCFPEGELKNLPRGEAPLVGSWEGRPALLRLSDAPEQIRLGEVKPLAFLEKSSGASQLDGYKEGISNTARLLKELRKRAETQDPKKMVLDKDCPALFVKKGNNKQWSPSVDDLKPEDYGKGVQPLTLIPVAGQSRRKLALYTFDPDAIIKKQAVILPPRDLGGQVYGDLYYIIQTGLTGGVVTYTWLLTNPIDLQEELPRLTREQQRYEARARAAYNRLVVPLLRPVRARASAGTARRLPLRRSKPIQREPVGETLRRQPKQPGAAPEPPGTDNNFNLNSWLAEHGKLADEFKDSKVRESKDVVKFFSGAVKAQKNLERHLPNAKIPPQVKGAEVLEKKTTVENLLTGDTEPGRTGKSREMTLPEMVALVELWTSKKVVPLAVLRKAFGGFMAGVLNWLADIPQKFADWRKKRDESDAKITDDQANKASKHDKLITGILRLAWKALKLALGRAFGQAVKLLISATERGVLNRLKKLFLFEVLKADDPDGPLAYALAVQQKIESVYDQLRDFVEDAIKPILSFIEQFKDFYDFLKNFKQIADIISRLKTTLKLIKYSTCAAGGWWGVLKCLVTSPAQDLMLLFLSVCKVRKEIASILFGLSWVRELPREIAGLMRSAILSLLPDDWKDLIEDIPVFLHLEPIELGCDEPPKGATPGSGQAGTGAPGGAGPESKTGGGAAPGEGEGEGVFAIEAKNKAKPEKSTNVLPNYALRALGPDCRHVEIYKAGDQNKESLYPTINVVVQDRKTKSPVMVVTNVKVKIVKVDELGAGRSTVYYSPLYAERLCPAEPADERQACQAALPKELHEARLIADPKKSAIPGDLPYCSSLEKLK
jgi:hypothetical protein